MKILKIAFENLNSLAGTWRIDLTDPVFMASPLFAIVGETGSGKTTILDAICLALYGKTPRLSNQMEEVMTRGTGKCSAAVEFCTDSICYEAKWELKRAREKSNGAPQKVVRTLTCITTGQIDPASGSITKVNDRIEELTGLDFDRFSRSMMLAQGSFAAFLKADEKARSSLLEQMTGTQIYSQISTKVYKKTDEYAKEVKSFEEKIGDMTLMTEQERSALVEELETLERDKKTSEETKSRIDAQIQWLIDIDKIQQRLDGIQAEDIAWHRENEAFESQRPILERGIRSAQMADLLRKCDDQRKEHQETIGKLQIAEGCLPGLKAELTNTLSKKDETGIVVEMNKKKLDEEMPKLKALRELNAELRNLEKQKNDETAKVRKLQSENSLITQSLEEAHKKQAEVISNIDKGRVWLEEHASDAELTSHITELNGVLSQIADAQAPLSDLNKRRVECLKVRENAQDTLKRTKENAEKSKLQLEKAQDAETSITRECSELLNGRTLDDIDKEINDLRIAQHTLKDILDLADYRQGLEEGTPCPLCGSLHHPGISEDIASMKRERDEQLSALETLRKNIEKAEKGVAEAQKKVLQLKNTYDSDTSQYDLAAKDLESAEQKLTELQNDIAAQELKLQTQNARFRELASQLGGMTPDEAPESFIQSLKQRESRYQAGMKRLDERKQEKLEIDLKLSSIEGQAKEKSNAIELMTTSLSDLNACVVNLQTRKQEMYGTMDPDKAENELRNKLETTQAQLQALEKQYHTCETRLAQKQTEVTALKSQTETEEAKLQESAQELDNRAQELGFESPDEARNAALPADTLHALQSEAERLRTQRHAIDTRRETEQKTLDTERAKALTEDSLDNLRNQADELKNRIDENNISLGKNREKLAEDDNKRSKSSEYQVQLDAARSRHLRWSRLNELIGQCDGGKYKRFAQGVTLSFLITYANEYLKALSNRYILTNHEPTAAKTTRKKKSDVAESKSETPTETMTSLSFRVIDSDMGGENRPIENLSGGESFLVSLALAFGLSKMASKNVRIESLFIDEGFGTLDEDTLQSSLSALACMNNGTRQIGIISHVEALKETVRTQIRVEKKSGGHSVIHIDT